MWDMIPHRFVCLDSYFDRSLILVRAIASNFCAYQSDFRAYSKSKRDNGIGFMQINFKSQFLE
jgi:hypothetical protein